MREVIPRLVRAGHQVRGVDNFGRYGRQEPPPDIEFVEGDLTDSGTVQRAMRGMEAVIQAAAQIYGVAGFHRLPADILQRDPMLHGLVLREAAAREVERVVYISSSMVYERLADVADERDVADLRVPLTDYGLSKLVGERLSLAFTRQYGLAHTIWRPFNIIGLHERVDDQEPGISHVFADFIHRIVVERQNPLLVLGSGDQVRCFTWIGDVADAIARFSFADVTRNQAFNLGNPEPVTMKELATRVYRVYHEVLGVPPRQDLRFAHGPTYADDVLVRIPAIEKARTVLEWEPAASLDTMLRWCVEHVLETDLAGAH